MVNDNKSKNSDRKINPKKTSKISKTSEANPENKMKKSRNVWKILAIVFVALFIVIMTLGILRSHRFREPPQQLTQEQIASVKNIALNDMNSKEIMVVNYTISTSGVSRMIKTDSIQRNVTEVAVYNSTARYMYIIDADTGKILVFSKTEFYDGLNYMNNDRRINDNGADVPPGPPPGGRRLFGQ